MNTEFFKELNIKESFINVDGIAPKVLEMMKSNKSKKASNRGGWQGVLRKYHFEEFEWIQYLTTELETVTGYNNFKRFWFNVNGFGHYNVWHRHPAENEVAVIYIQVPNNSGNIEFRKSDDSEIFSIQPVKGMVLVFPGSLQHQVTSNQSKDPRISLAVNLC